MAIDTWQRIPHAPRARRHSAMEFRLIFAIAFPFFLVAAVFARLIPWRRSSHGFRSLLEDARHQANACIPYAFMG